MHPRAGSGHWRGWISGVGFGSSGYGDIPVRDVILANGYFAPTATCDDIQCAPVRAEVRKAHAGAPDSEQFMFGAPPDIKAGPEVRTPTVRFQRH